MKEQQEALAKRERRQARIQLRVLDEQEGTEVLPQAEDAEHLQDPDHDDAAAERTNRWNSFE